MGICQDLILPPTSKSVNKKRLSLSIWDPNFVPLEPIYWDIFFGKVQNFLSSLLELLYLVTALSTKEQIPGPVLSNKNSKNAGMTVFLGV